MSTVLETTHEVTARIRALEPQLRTRGVKRLALFGSFVRNESHADSDVDMLVEFIPGHKTFDNFLAVCELLEQTLQRPIELVTLESLSPHIGPHILREAQDVIFAS
jgi:predicted nucleotidyltransferase